VNKLSAPQKKQNSEKSNDFLREIVESWKAVFSIIGNSFSLKGIKKLANESAQSWKAAFSLVRSFFGKQKKLVSNSKNNSKVEVAKPIPEIRAVPVEQDFVAPHPVTNTPIVVNPMIAAPVVVESPIVAMPFEAPVNSRPAINVPIVKQPSVSPPIVVVNEKQNSKPPIVPKKTSAKIITDKFKALLKVPKKEIKAVTNNKKNRPYSKSEVDDIARIAVILGNVKKLSSRVRIANGAKITIDKVTTSLRVLLEHVRRKPSGSDDPLTSFAGFDNPDFGGAFDTDFDNPFDISDNKSQPVSKTYDDGQWDLGTPFDNWDELYGPRTALLRRTLISEMYRFVRHLVYTSKPDLWNMSQQGTNTSAN